MNMNPEWDAWVDVSFIGLGDCLTDVSHHVRIFGLEFGCEVDHDTDMGYGFTILNSEIPELSVDWAYKKQQYDDDFLGIFCRVISAIVLV